MWEMKVLSRQVSKMILSRLNETDEPKSTVSALVRASNHLQQRTVKCRARAPTDARPSSICIARHRPSCFAAPAYIGAG